jgi:glycosidase
MGHAARLLLLLPLLVPLASCTTAGGPAPAVPAVAAGLDWDLDWARDAVFYEVFVRSFADSDGDGVGDLAGLTARLDHLNDGDPETTSDLGVDALWLMPVFESPSYHGYDVVDYRSIDREYGSAEDFAAFLDAAHARGMRVVLDLMVNHTSAGHPWFEESRRGPDAPRRDWYVWRPDDPGWTQPWGAGPTWHRNDADGWYYYGIFWGGMPDLDFRNPAVRAEVKDLAVHWLALGVDGFRLDAARHIVADGPGEAQNDTPETHAWWADFARHVHAADPSALLIGENWTDAAHIAPYFAELPMNFNFPLAEAMVEAAKTGAAAPVAAALAAMAAEYPPGALAASFLTNHDMVRLASQVGGGAAERRRRLAGAAALLLTLPGPPFVYYGEEVGLENGPGREDEWKRTPMPWNDREPGGGFTAATPWHRFAPGREAANVAAQLDDPGSLLSRYRDLVRLRRASPALRGGGTEVLRADGAVLALVRAGGGERLLVVHNLGGTAATTELAVPATAGDALWADPGAGVERVDGGGWRVSLPAGASGVWRLAP